MGKRQQSRSLWAATSPWRRQLPPAPILGLRLMCSFCAHAYYVQCVLIHVHKHLCGIVCQPNLGTFTIYTPFHTFANICMELCAGIYGMGGFVNRLNSNHQRFKLNTHGSKRSAICLQHRQTNRSPCLSTHLVCCKYSVG